MGKIILFKRFSGKGWKSDIELYLFRRLVGGLMLGQGFIYWTGFPFKHCDIMWRYEALPPSFRPPRRPVQVEGKNFNFWNIIGIVREWFVYRPAEYHNSDYSQLCQHEGCTLHATRYLIHNTPVDEFWLCDDHAAEMGFCINCGWFMSGSGEESNTNGWCSECLEEMLIETGDYDDDDAFDDPDYLNNPYEDEWHDSDSGLSELEADLGNPSNGKYIGEGSEYPPGIDD